MTYIPTHTEVQDRVHWLINEMTNFARTEFDLVVPRFDPRIMFRTCKRTGIAGRDRFGKPSMGLNLGELVTYPVLAFLEYKNLNRYRHIHSFKTNDWMVWLDALVAHEFAHVIQFQFPLSNSSLKQGYNYFSGLGRFEDGHGDFFRAIYAKLRIRFVNDRADMQDFNWGKKSFDCPEIIVEKKLLRSKFDGTKLRVPMPRGIVEATVCGINTRNRKYPYIAVDAKGGRIKLTEAQVALFRVA